MTKVYIVRHCEAQGNLMRIFQGHTNLDITELGGKQLEALRQRFNKIHIDKVFSSPLTRAKKTGLAIIGDKGLPLEVESGLIEINGGVIEGMTYEDIYRKYPDFKDMWQNHPEDFAPENGETMLTAYERIWNTILRLAKENKDKTIACATHGGVIRCLISRLIKDDINELITIPIGLNTSVSFIEFDENFNFTLKFWNDNSHLSDELINPKSLIPVK